ncbi:MAG: FkbM family methyltransferase, partial [Chitinophagaceae bacterium]
GNRITLVPEGLGDKVEEKTMFISGSSTISSLSEEWIESVRHSRFSGHEWNNTETIRINTLDNLIAEYGLPFFCKIDVEGYELQVLKGLSQPIPIMSLEYTVPEQTSRLAECIDTCYRLDPGYEYNYTVGEQLSFQLASFVTYETFARLIHGQPFQQSGFGDIYVKLRSV